MCGCCRACVFLCCFGWCCEDFCYYLFEKGTRRASPPPPPPQELIEMKKKCKRMMSISSEDLEYTPSSPMTPVELPDEDPTLQVETALVTEQSDSFDEDDVEKIFEKVHIKSKFIKPLP